MKEGISRFNIRVYGLLINSAGELLLSSENRRGFTFTKFPGGGLEFGEGLIDCLKREFMEELDISIDIKSHFYTTDFFQQSAFRKEDQLISVYYLVESTQVDQIKEAQTALDVEEGNEHRLHWRKITEIESSDLTFPIDQLVLSQLKEIL